MYSAPSPLALTVEDLASGRVALEEHVNRCCDLIDANEPVVRALLPEPGRRDRLLQQAAALAAAYPCPSSRPPLYGILLGVKDVIHVSGFSTGAGSQLDPSLLTGQEGDAVGCLRRAGALVLGKTVTTEFAYFEPGPTVNPHNPAHTPGGSSSGSAAAVAAGFCQLALGTQTVGSVIRPAAFCGLVGFKPTYGRVPANGLINFSPSADHVGCFTQDCAGMLMAAENLVREWQEIKINYRPVLGVPGAIYLGRAGEAALDCFWKKIERLSSCGYEVKEVRVLDEIEEPARLHQTLVAFEMAAVHRDWFATHGEKYRPRTAELIGKGQAISAAEASLARQAGKKLRRRLEEAARESGVDLWVSPAAPGPAPEGLASTGDPIMNLPWTAAGLPALTLPSGFTEGGLPLGLQFAAPFMGDELLLSWARDLEEPVAAG